MWDAPGPSGHIVGQIIPQTWKNGIFFGIFPLFLALFFKIANFLPLLWDTRPTIKKQPNCLKKNLLESQSLLWLMKGYTFGMIYLLVIDNFAVYSLRVLVNFLDRSNQHLIEYESSDQYKIWFGLQMWPSNSIRVYFKSNLL